MSDLSPRQFLSSQRRLSFTRKSRQSDGSIVRASQESTRSLLDKSAQLLQKSSRSRNSTSHSATTSNETASSALRTNPWAASSALRTSPATMWASFDHVIDLSDEGSSAESTQPRAGLPAAPSGFRSAGAEDSKCVEKAVSMSLDSGVHKRASVDTSGVTNALAAWAIEEMSKAPSKEIDLNEAANTKEMEDHCKQLQEQLALRTEEAKSLQQLVWSLKMDLASSEESQRRLVEENRTLKEECIAAFDRENARCVVCLDGQATQVVVPCGHLALCETCDASRDWHSCPVCRQTKSMAIKLFKP